MNDYRSKQILVLECEDIGESITNTRYRLFSNSFLMIAAVVQLPFLDAIIASILRVKHVIDSHKPGLLQLNRKNFNNTEFQSSQFGM